MRSSARALLLLVATAALALAPSLVAAPGPDANAPARSTDEGTPRDAPADVVDYQLRADLAADHRTITATETLRWTNPSRVAATELWWHLYMNAFADAGTLFMRTGGSQGHRGHAPGAWGRIDVLSLRLPSGEDLLAGASHDPAVPGDATQLRTPLPRPVAPGETLTLEVRFRVTLPAAFARTGFYRNFAFVGQWFPKLAVLEPDGRWAHFPFHAQTEFYADFGRYDVTLTVPHGDVVGATGERAEAPRLAPSGDVHHFVASAVHDFAWTAWADFREREERVGAVRVRALYPPGEDAAIERALASLRWAMPQLERTLGSYPYPGLTVVLPPRGASGVGGMEYPTLITTEGAWLLPRGLWEPEWVTVHEFAHQYFYGLFASDEWSWPFLDEGLAEYATGRALCERYGEDRSFADLLGVHGGFFELHAALSGTISDALPVASGAAAFPEANEYAAHVYSRTATILRTAERAYGRERFLRGLRLYAQRARFRHPGPEDLLAAFRDGAGDDVADGFLRPALLGPASVDYALESVESHRAPPGSPTAFVGSARVRRRGALAVPIELEFERDDGARLRVPWDGRDDAVTLPYAGPSPLRSARLDPGQRVLLDRSRLDNARTVSGDAGSALPLSGRLAYWLGLLLRAVGP